MLVMGSAMRVDCFCQGLLHRHHVMAIGVEQCFLIGHDSHMAFPKNQIAAAQAIKIIDP